MLLLVPCKRGRESWLASIKGCRWQRSSDTSNYGVLDCCFPAKGASCLEVGLGVVDQVVSFGHVPGNAESIDKTVNELLVRDKLTKVIKLRADPVEVVEVAS